MIQQNTLTDERLFKHLVTSLYAKGSGALADLIEAMNILHGIKETYQRNLCGTNLRKEMVSRIDTTSAIGKLNELADILVPELKKGTTL